MKKLPSESETVISAQQISLEAARIVVLPRRGRIESVCFRREEREDRKEGENVRRMRRTLPLFRVLFWSFPPTREERGVPRAPCALSRSLAKRAVPKIFSYKCKKQCSKTPSKCYYISERTFQKQQKERR